MHQGSSPDIRSNTRSGKPSRKNSAAREPTGETKRVCFVYNTAAYLLRFRSELMREFQERGFECHAVLPAGVVPEEARTLTDRGITLHVLEHFINQRITPVSDVRLVHEYYGLYQQLKPEVVFNFTIKPCIYSGIAARLAGVPRIAATITGLGYAFSDESLSGRVMAWLAGLAYRIALHGHTVVFFQNTEDHEYFRRRSIASAARNVIIEGSGIDTTLFAPAGRPQPGPAFLMVARLLRTKGVLEYLEACRLTKQCLPAARCVLVGPFDDNPSGIGPEVLQPYIEQGVIEYKGYLSDPLAEYQSATVYVLPSYAEGRPRTVLEAMACGLAIITSDARGCREAIEPGVNGYLVPVKSAALLSERMIELGREPGRVREMGLASRRLAEERYDVRRITETIWRAVQDPASS